MTDADLSPHELLHHAEEPVHDPTLALAAIGALRKWLEEREETLIRAARSDGHSWQGIATFLGRSKQAVWEKYRNPADSSDDNPNG